MIRKRADLIYYLKEDKRALGNSGRHYPSFIGDDVWRCQILLRRHEYYTNATESSMVQRML